MRSDNINQRIPLPQSEIHLWLVYYDEIREGALTSVYRELLSGEEREQEPRFYFANDRQRYLVTRALVRTVLSRYESISPREWTFSKNSYGRPEIANVQATEACLKFSISHTRSLIVLGVTKRRALGVDVENVLARKASIDIADRYFAPQEVAVLASVPQVQQQYRFFEYWTFKEAYIKARGMGLYLPLDKFNFSYPDDSAVEISIDPELADDSSNWQFWQFRPTTEYLVAICAEKVCKESRMVVRQAIPLLSETTLACKFLRTSEVAAETTQP